MRRQSGGGGGMMPPAIIFPFTFQGSQDCFADGVETDGEGARVVEQLLMIMEMTQQAAIFTHFSGSEKRWSRSHRLAATGIWSGSC